MHIRKVKIQGEKIDRDPPAPGENLSYDFIFVNLIQLYCGKKQHKYCKMILGKHRISLGGCFALMKVPEVDLSELAQQ